MPNIMHLNRTDGFPALVLEHLLSDCCFIFGTIPVASHRQGCGLAQPEARDGKHKQT